MAGGWGGVGLTTMTTPRGICSAPGPMRGFMALTNGRSTLAASKQSRARPSRSRELQEELGLGRRSPDLGASPLLALI